MKNKKLLGILIALLLCILAIPFAGFAETDKVEFKTWDYTQKKMVDAFVGSGVGAKAAEYTVINSNHKTTTLGQESEVKWYVVDGVADYGTNGITVTGEVHLILKDGCNLSVTGTGSNAGIKVTEGNKLTIYGQSGGTGKLTAQGGSYNGVAGGAGIGGGSECSGSNITINGGDITATGGDRAAGIGGGKSLSGSNITINGGKVIATGKDGGAGIGGGREGSGSNITITGGKVTATGGDQAAGIGGGYEGSASNIFAAANMVVKAGDSPSPQTEIAHTAETDLATDTTTKDAFLKQYVTAVRPEIYKVTCEGTDETTPDSLKYALANVKAGGIIRLDADITLTATVVVAKEKNFTLDLNGHNLDGTNIPTPTATGQKASVIYLAGDNTGGATLTLDDTSRGEPGKITGGKGTYYYGVLLGGGVYVNTKATFNMKGGKISGNTSTNGGGVCLAGSSPTFNMAGGEISGNTSDTGGGVNQAINTAIFNMSGGVISGNHANTGGGGVYQFGNTTISGSAQITGNTSGESKVPDNLYFHYDSNFQMTFKINVGGLQAGASIGITTQKVPTAGSPVAFTSNGAETDAQYFFSDQDAYEVNFAAATETTAAHLELIKKPFVTVTNTKDNENEGSLRWALAQGSDTIKFDPSLDGATITLGSMLNITKDVTIDASDLANGITIDGNQNTRGINAVSCNVKLIGLTITNKGKVGVYFSSDQEKQMLSMKDCVVKGCGNAVVAQGMAELENCLIVDNIGMAFYADTNFNITITNCTVAGNLIGLSVGDSQNVVVQNSIIVKNNMEVNKRATGIINAHNTISKFTNWSNKDDEGVINYAYDSTKPLFVDYQNKDYHLSTDSQACNKGNNTYCTASKDLGGYKRVMDTAIDLGCYEYQYTFTGYQGAYDGQAHNAVSIAPALEAGEKAYYKTAGSTDEWAEGIPQITDQKEDWYTYDIKVVREGYTDVIGNNVQAKISKYALISNGKTTTYDDLKDAAKAAVGGDEIQIGTAKGVVKISVIKTSFNMWDLFTVTAVPSDYVLTGDVLSDLYGGTGSNTVTVNTTTDLTIDLNGYQTVSSQKILQLEATDSAVLTIKDTGATPVNFPAKVSAPSENASVDSDLYPLMNTGGSHVYYRTFEDALEGAKAGDTIKMVKDITIAKANVSLDKNITLDLNTKTLTLDDDKALKISADVTITNGKVAKVIDVTAGDVELTDLTVNTLNVTGASTVVTLDKTEEKTFSVTTVSIQNGAKVKKPEGVVIQAPAKHYWKVNELKALTAADFDFTPPEDCTYRPEQEEDKVAKVTVSEASDAFGIVTDNDITVYYEGKLKDGSEYAKTTAAPKKPGNYTVSIDVGRTEAWPACGGYTGLTDTTWKFTILECLGDDYPVMPLEKSGNYVMFLDEERAGAFDIQKDGNTWTLQCLDSDQTGKYLAVDENTELVYSDQPAKWSYMEGRGFYVTTVKEQHIWIITWKMNITYYLVLNIRGELDLRTYYDDCTFTEYRHAYDDHEWGTYTIDEGGATHSKVCKHCSAKVTEEHTYDETTHVCVCGSVDPAYYGISGVLVYEVKHEVKILWISKTTYEYVIQPITDNVKVESLAYSTDGGKSWTEGNRIFSNSQLTSFRIKVTDSGKRVTNWLWTGDTEAKPEN